MPRTALLPDPVTELLLGKVRRQLLALLLFGPDEPFHLRGLARLTGTSVGALHRELRALERVGLVRSDRRGNQVCFRTDDEAPTLPALRTFLEQTVGAPDLIRAALAPLAGRVAFALIHGPAAAGTMDAESGIDLFIVGDVAPAEVSDALASVAPRLARPVYPAVCTLADFDARAVATPHFITATLGSPCIPLIGEPPLKWAGSSTHPLPVN